MPDAAKLKQKALSYFLLGVIISGAFLFIPAGSFDFWQGWVYLGVLFIPGTLASFYFLKHDPKLIERRMRMKEKELTQKGVMALSVPLFIIGFIVPGLDYRFGWSEVPVELIIVSNIIVFLSYIAILQVLKVNSYASRVVEVEKDQKVITTGPYALVRHPMYSALLIMLLATPTALGSYWSYIPFFAFFPLLVIRLLNEEEVLKRDLPGYKEYCKKTTYRLIPYVW